MLLPGTLAFVAHPLHPRVEGCLVAWLLETIATGCRRSCAVLYARVI